MKKKVIACAIVMFFYGDVFAGEMGGVDLSQTNWSVGADALYLKPDIGSLNARGLSSAIDNKTTYLTYGPSYLWGFKVYGSYFVNAQDDITLEWYRVEQLINKNFGGLLSSAGDLLSYAAGSIDPSWNAVNLEFAHTLSLSENLSARLHAGAEYAQIAMNETRQVVIASNNLENYASINRVYNGFGARLGGQLQRELPYGLSLYGNSAVAILAGTAGSNTVYTALYSDRSISTFAMVPELETKLGINYRYPSLYGKFTADLGWLWINYFNATLNDNFSLTNRLIDVVQLNFGLQGLFFGMKWQGETF